MLSFNAFLTEGNPLARVHKMSQSGRHFVTMSTERPNQSAEERNKRNADLESKLKKQGYSYRKAAGHWEGDKESSYQVYAKGEGSDHGKHLVRDMSAHARHYGQDAIMHHNPNRSSARLIGTNKTGYPGFKKRVSIGRVAYNKPEQPGQTELRQKNTEKPLKPGRTAGTGKKFTTA